MKFIEILPALVRGARVFQSGASYATITLNSGGNFNRHIGQRVEPLRITEEMIFSVPWLIYNGYDSQLLDGNEDLEKLLINLESNYSSASDIGQVVRIIRKHLNGKDAEVAKEPVIRKERETKISSGWVLEYQGLYWGELSPEGCQRYGWIDDISRMEVARQIPCPSSLSYFAEANSPYIPEMNKGAWRHVKLTTVTTMEMVE